MTKPSSKSRLRSRVGVVVAGSVVEHQLREHLTIVLVEEDRDDGRGVDDDHFGRPCSS
jgi:hypothetical protein